MEKTPSQGPGEDPHDILAAEEFGIGTRDDRHPPDPTGIHEPHDVLAAEEFAMPTAVDPRPPSGGSLPRTLLPLALGALALVLLRRRRRS